MEAKSASCLPILIGSGLSPENLKNYWKLADGFIIGSWIKEKGDWTCPVDIERAKKFIEQAKRLNG